MIVMGLDRIWMTPSPLLHAPNFLRPKIGIGFPFFAPPAPFVPVAGFSADRLRAVLLMVVIILIGDKGLTTTVARSSMEDHNRLWCYEVMGIRGTDDL